MDSLYAHALKFFTDRFGNGPVPSIPENLAMAGIGFDANASLPVSDPEALTVGVFHPIWCQLCGHFAYRRIEVSLWQPIWTLRGDGGAFLDLVVVTEPDAMKVAEAFARIPAPEDVHPFADRLQPLDVARAAKLVEGVEPMRDGVEAAIPHRLRPRGVETIPGSPAWEAEARALGSGRAIMDRLHDGESVRLHRRDRGASAPITPAMTEDPQPGPLRDVGHIDVQEYWNRSQSKLAAHATTMPVWGDLSDGDLLQAMGTDAAKWAAAFHAIRRNSGEPLSHEIMIGWFANAIEAGREAGRPKPVDPAAIWHRTADIPEGVVHYYDVSNDAFRPVTREWVDYMQSVQRALAGLQRDVRKALEQYDINKAHIDAETKSS